jgi:hypothetical protein
VIGRCFWLAHWTFVSETGADGAAVESRGFGNECRVRDRLGFTSRRFVWPISVAPAGKPASQSAGMLPNSGITICACSRSSRSDLYFGVYSVCFEGSNSRFREPVGLR